MIGSPAVIRHTSLQKFTPRGFLENIVAAPQCAPLHASSIAACHAAGMGWDRKLSDRLATTDRDEPLITLRDVGEYFRRTPAASGATILASAWRSRSSWTRRWRAGRHRGGDLGRALVLAGAGSPGRAAGAQAVRHRSRHLGPLARPARAQHEAEMKRPRRQNNPNEVSQPKSALITMAPRHKSKRKRSSLCNGCIPKSRKEDRWRGALLGLRGSPGVIGGR